MYGSTREQMLYEANKKEVLVAYLLWFFLCVFGAHRFYLGRMGSGAGQLALAVLGLPLMLVGVGFLMWLALGIWVIVDAVLIPGMVREHNMALIERMP